MSLLHSRFFKVAARAAFLLSALALAPLAQLRAQVTSTFISGLSGATGVAADGLGNVYVANNVAISKYSQAGALLTSYPLSYYSPYGTTTDSANNVYIAYYSSNVIVKLTPAGVLSTFTTGVSQPIGLAMGNDGYLYVASRTGPTIMRVSPAGAVSTFVTLPNYPVGMARDAAGNLYVGYTANFLSKVTTAGVISTFATGFNGLYGVAVATGGDIYACDYSASLLRKITAAGVVTNVPGTYSYPWCVAYDPAGLLYVANNGNGTVTRVVLAGSIGVNFTGGAFALSTTDQPGVASGANWNNFAGASGSLLALQDNTATATTARLTFNSTNAAASYPGTGTANAATNTLYKAGLYGDNTVREVSVTVSAIPYAVYDVYVYSGGSGATNTLSVSNGTTTYYYRGNGSSDATATSLLRTTSTDLNNPTVGPGQYQLFTNLTGSSLTLTTGGSINGTTTNDIYGIQIVQRFVPPVITSALTAAANVGQTFAYNITADYAPFSFGATSLPSGLAVNSTSGLISGTPSTAGSFSVPISATNAAGTGTATLSLTIGNAIGTITLGNLSQTYNGSQRSVTATTSPAGMTVNILYNGSATAPTNAGSYPVLATISNANYTGSTTGTLLINPAAATLTLGNLTQPYDGSAKSVSVTTVPAGLATAVTYNGSATAPSAVGSYAVAATSANANYTGSTSGTLQITDTIPPALSLPANLTLEATSATGAIATFSATANDNVDGTLAVTLTPASGSLFPIGVTTVTGTATDAVGNIGTGSFTVTVVDTTPPVITAPADIVTEATGAAGAVVTFSFSAVDSVDSAVSVTSSPASGSTFPLGTTIVTVTATDSHGNSAAQTFAVTVHDSTAPVIAAQQNLIVEATGAAGAAVAFTPSALDLVDGAVSVTTSVASGSTFALGTTPVSLTATDAAGNASTSSFTVTVVDTTAPVIAPPATTTAEATSAAGAVVAFAPTANDLVDGAVSVTASPASGSVFPIGSTTVTLAAVDAAGNSSSSSFTVTVADTTAPVLTTPASQTLEATSAAGAGATFAASATDAVGATVSTSVASGSTFPLGVTTVTVTATDAAGNASTGAFTITVVDTTAPVIAVPGNIVTEATGAAGAVATFTSSATDIVSGAVTVSSSIASGSTFALGTTAVTLTATDAAGNTATAVFSVTVSDTIAPVIAAQDNLIVEAASAAGAVVAFTPAAADIVSGAVSVTAAPASGSTFALGTTTVALTTQDAAGNSAASTFTVTVRDTTAPVIAAQPGLVLEATSAAGAVATFWPTSFDLVDGAVSGTASPASGSVFAIGSTTVSLLATDAAGNSSTSSFTVTVADTTAPVLTTPANQTLEATSAAGAVATYAATATDAVGATIAYSIAPGSTFPLGTTTVNVTATDAAGNQSNGSFTITVVDTTAPAITPPANLVIEATGATGALATFSASASDLVDGAVAVTSSIVSGSTFSVGTTAVTLTATDAAGNVSTATFSVTVTDTTSPIIAAQDNLVIEATSAAGAVATFTPAASDIVSGAVSVTATPASGSTFALGTTTVALATQDAAGNSAAGSFTVTVVDTTAPAIATPAAITAEATSPAGAVVTFAPTASDLVDGVVAVTAAPAYGSVFAVGTTTVTLTSTDAHGNVGTSSFDVTVVDTTAPVIAVPADLVIEATSGLGAVATFATTASDLVDGSDPVTFSPASGSTFALGTTTVTITATDAAGNTATATFTVTVRDTTAPAIAPLADQTLEATSAAGAIANYLATATDAVGATVSTSIAPGSTFPLGATVVTVTAEDAAGNVSTATFTVTVRDTLQPLLVLPASQTLEATGPAGAVATFSASASDIVSGALPVAFNAPSGAVFPLGITIVTASATDGAANLAAGSFSITVRDTTAPVIAPQANLVLEATGPAGAIATFAPTAADLVSGAVAVVPGRASGSTFVLGTTTVGLTATDGAGNVSTGSFTVTVRDTTPPVLTTPADLVIDATSVLGQTVTFSVTATDLVSGALPVTLSKASGTVFSLGITTVTATATDAAGNTITKTFTVTLRAPAAALVNELSANNGTINGSLQQNNPAGTNFNGGGALTGEFLVVGTPTIRKNGNPALGGTVDGTGSTSPSGYTITLNGGATVGRIVRRVNALALPTVAAPANPTGTRGVNLNRATDPIGAWSTLKDLTLNGNVGNVTVPAGTYGSFTANGGSGFILGVAGATTPTVYQFQSLTLNGNSTFQIVGPVVIIVKNGLNANSAMGNTAHPEWLDLRIASGGFTLNGNVSFAGYVTAPTGTVTVNGSSRLVGGLTADKLVVNGGGIVTLLRR